MNKAFIIKNEVYSFKKVNVLAFIEVCESLNITMNELRDRMNRQDLRTILHMMYYAIRDRKDLTIEDMYGLDKEHFELLLDLYIEVNK